MKLYLEMQDDDGATLSQVTVNNIPDDLKEHPVDPFADLEGRLREIAGAAAHKAHRNARKILDARQ